MEKQREYRRDLFSVRTWSPKRKQHNVVSEGLGCLGSMWGMELGLEIH